MNIYLEKQTIQALQNSFPFKWQTTALLYLGIHLTLNRQTLYQENYPLLYKILSDNLQRWAKNPPSWFGRLRSLKMNVLPRLLYLFRTLPVTLNMSDRKKFQ